VQRIKSPNDTDQGKSPFAKPAADVVDGEPGFEKRSNTSKGVPEVTYDRSGSKSLDIKTPANTPISMPKK
jgi:hypothetical protein